MMYCSYIIVAIFAAPMLLQGSYGSRNQFEDIIYPRDFYEQDGGYFDTSYQYGGDFDTDYQDFDTESTEISTLDHSFDIESYRQGYQEGFEDAQRNSMTRTSMRAAAKNSKDDVVVYPAIRMVEPNKSFWAKMVTSVCNIYVKSLDELMALVSGLASRLLTIGCTHKDDVIVIFETLTDAMKKFLVTSFKVGTMIGKKAIGFGTMVWENSAGLRSRIYSWTKGKWNAVKKWFKKKKQEEIPSSAVLGQQEANKMVTKYHVKEITVSSSFRSKGKQRVFQFDDWQPFFNFVDECSALSVKQGRT